MVRVEIDLDLLSKVSDTSLVDGKNVVGRRDSAIGYQPDSPTETSTKLHHTNYIVTKINKKKKNILPFTQQMHLWSYFCNLFSQLLFIVCFFHIQQPKRT